MLQRLILAVAPKLLYPCLLWWVTWSKVYRAIFHGKYWVYPVYTVALPTVVRWLALLKWTADAAPELWDSCGSPSWVQYCIQEILAGRPQPKGSLDCDDSSVWAAHALPPEYEPRLMTVVWLNQRGTVSGHVVCLGNEPADAVLFHLGNWGMYEAPSDLRSAVTQILGLANAKALIGWAILDKNLTIVKHGRELPEIGYDGSVR